jgi:hypothetical protein
VHFVLKEREFEGFIKQTSRYFTWGANKKERNERKIDRERGERER